MASERALPLPGARVLPFLRANRWTATLADAARMLAQVAVLWAFSAGGGALQALLHLPVPGNVIGMCALFAGLATGALRLEWFELGGGFLTKHLAFFFVPVTVGVMSFGSTFARAGAGIAAALLISTVAGLIVAGLTTQLLARRR
ncbi:MAG TPA: CidA/LrgA family protein [Candidatus Elarobacter sp.]|nr:CidA/LrgA family protein [Candidatus Elarobacter sp.]